VDTKMFLANRECFNIIVKGYINTTKKVACVVRAMILKANQIKEQRC